MNRLRRLASVLMVLAGSAVDTIHCYPTGAYEDIKLAGRCPTGGPDS